MSGVLRSILAALPLAGARPDVARMRTHGLAEASHAPILCDMGRPGVVVPPSPMAARPLKHERVRAVVVMAPAGVLLTIESLATVRTATLICEAELDRFGVPHFHAEWVAGHLPAPNPHRVPNAGRFAFMDRPSVPLPSPVRSSQLATGTWRDPVPTRIACRAVHRGQAARRRHGHAELTCSRLEVKRPRWLPATQAIDAVPPG